MNKLLSKLAFVLSLGAANLFLIRLFPDAAGIFSFVFLLVVLLLIVVFYIEGDNGQD